MGEIMKFYNPSKGLAEYLRRLSLPREDFPVISVADKIQEATYTVLTDIGNSALQKYKSVCRVDTGTLRDRCEVVTSKVGAKIIFDFQFYMIFLEYGTDRITADHNFRTSLNEAIDETIIINDSDDPWIKFAKNTIAKNRSLVRVKINATDYPRNKTNKK